MRRVFRPQPPSAAAGRRQGFNLIELVAGLAIAALILGVIAALLLPSVRTARPAAYRSQCKGNLKQILLALHNYADANGDKFPPAFTTDANRKPLHSWRTLILPYIDQAQLYAKIDLSKPWDDSANAELLKAHVPQYQCPSSIHQDHTSYLAVVGDNAAFHPTEPRSIRDVKDGSSNTIMVVEVDEDHGVPWASPQDANEAMILSFGSKSKLAHNGGFHVAFVDGAVRYISINTTPDQRRALISINGHDDAGEY